MIATAEAQEVHAAWDDLCLHSLETCPVCRDHSAALRDDAPVCLEERELYRVWKRLWDKAGRPVGIAAEVSA